MATPQWRLHVYLDGLRDSTHHADGSYDDIHLAARAAMNALEEPATSEVRLIKMAAGNGGQNAPPTMADVED